MDAVDADHVAARPRRRHRPRRRRAQRAAMLTITEEDLTDVPITHEELPDERPSSPLPAPVPTFEYGITTADPAASWALFRTLSIQHDIMSSICEQLEIPRPAAIPYRLGPDPGPSRPPWSFFPPVDPPVVSTAGPSTGPTAAAADPDPALPTGFASPDRGLTEQLLAMQNSITPTSTDEIVSQAMAAMDFSIPSPTSVFDRDAEEEFDPDTDDLLDDF